MKEEFEKWLLNEMRAGHRTIYEYPSAWEVWLVRQHEIDELRRDNAALQAKIDALMLEYCPREMFASQVAEWGKSQGAAESDVVKGDLK